MIFSSLFGIETIHLFSRRCCGLRLSPTFISPHTISAIFVMADNPPSYQNNSQSSYFPRMPSHPRYLSHGRFDRLHSSSAATTILSPSNLDFRRHSPAILSTATSVTPCNQNVLPSASFPIPTKWRPHLPRFVPIAFWHTSLQPASHVRPTHTDDLPISARERSRSPSFRRPSRLSLLQ